MRRSHLTLLLLPVALAVTACSGGDDDAGPATVAGPPSTAAADPCTLVTATELAALLGAAPGAVGPRDQFRGRTCDWSTPSGASLSLTVWSGRQFFLDDPAAVAVPALGDAAHFEDNVVDAVTWRQGDVTAQLTGSVDEPAHDRLVDLARKVSARLS
jgi:hypothetical protein